MKPSLYVRQPDIWNEFHEKPHRGKKISSAFNLVHKMNIIEASVLKIRWTSLIEKPEFLIKKKRIK